MSSNTLTITDNRTGKSYEVPIENDTIPAVSLRQIKVNEDDFGMMTYDPGYENTASCKSTITTGGKEQFSRSLLPPHLRRTSQRTTTGRMGTQSQSSHLRPRKRSAIDAFLPLRCPPHGHDDQCAGNYVNSLQGRTRHQRR